MLVRRLGAGKYSDIFSVQTRPRGPVVVMRVSYYRDDTLCAVARRLKAGDTANALKAKRADAIQVSNTFSKLAASLRAVSPHFVVVFCETDCLDFAGRLSPLLKDRLSKLTPAQKKFNNVCFMEVFETNLTKFLVGAKYNEAALRGIVFQVLYTLAALQKRFPGFRHNDLSTNNVLVKRLRRAPKLAYSFESKNEGKTFYVTSPLLVALADYDFVHIPKVLENERVVGGKFRVDGRRNDSYDSHFFLKSVYKCIQRRVEQFPETTKFLAKLRLRTEDRQNSSYIPRIKPSTLLTDPYFAPLLHNTRKAVDARYAA